MLNIDENQLKLFLEQKRKVLERKKYDGIGEIIAAISLMITLALSDFSKLKFIKPGHFKFVTWGIAGAILVYGIYEFVRSLKIYSIEQLYSELTDLDPQKEHPFDIIVLRSSSEDGKYLVFKSKRWKCWLFPNYHCLEGEFSKSKELRYVRECVKRDINIGGELQFKYIGNKVSKKYSVGDRVRKKYNFHYFQGIDINVGEKQKGRFRYKGKTYTWKTLDEMYSDKNIVKKNKDVLDYVRHMCDIS